jgi:hypothetical protein
MRDYWGMIVAEKVLERRESVETDSELIEEVNYHKIRLAVETKVPTYEGFL